MFNSILIANRGEIACRIIKTVKKMGIEAIAVYSSADQYSEHVKLADRAYCIGEAEAASSYLNIKAVMDVALASHAEAIHPGYGFLSENADFARACADANIVFIGPPIKAMEVMASKQLAKQLLEKALVPITPGYHGKDQTDQRLIEEAEKTGFPILLKAASGGGGKGMRIVMDKKDFSHALAAARREAKASFADDTMIIEKYIAHPRHIEIQIMADNHGQAVHLFERDCSIQRRHQKIIEEATAAYLSPELRTNLAASSLEIAASIQYRGAGTVEFLVTPDEQYYFMEMNTRLQVEHPVTEMITGLDLVQWQIRIAANEPLPCSQENIYQKGHAIECRIYAEDPHHFMPSTGTINVLNQPEGAGIRIDSGIVEGSEVSIHYDPMVSKLIAWGNDRAEALRRMQQALKHYHIGGVKTNIPFLKAICSHPQFIEGQFSTAFLSEENIELSTPDVHLAVKLASAYDYLKAFEKITDPLYQDVFGWQPNLTNQWFWHYSTKNTPYEVNIVPVNGCQFQLKMKGETLLCSARLDKHELTVTMGVKQYRAFIVDDVSRLVIYNEQNQIIIDRFNQTIADTNASCLKGQLTSPMPATIVAVLKNIGEQVKEGERLIILEAMKMEHTIHAPTDGILTKLFYEPGSQVPEGAELLTLQEMPQSK